MIDQNFYPEIVKRLTIETYGPFGFSEFMLRYIEQWKNIEYQEILTIVELIKFTGGVYSFLPFCYLFIEIDLYTYYKQQVEVGNWDEVKAFAQIKSFKVHPLESFSDKKQLLDEFPEALPMLQAIKGKLIIEGAAPAGTESSAKK